MTRCLKRCGLVIGAVLAVLLLVPVASAHADGSQETVTVTVPSTQPWADTGLTVSAGDQISITAWGSVSWDYTGVPAGPDGRERDQDMCHYVVMDSDVPGQSLVGNVADFETLDGEGFFAGSSFQGTLPIAGTTVPSGKLFLGFNDGAVLCDRSGYDAWGFGGDNHGSFTAEITITRGCVRLIAFSSYRDGNREIYTMDANGDYQVRVTSNAVFDGNPQWSPDGTRIVFHTDRDGDYEVYAIDSDGTNPTRLTYNTGEDVRAMWSPDGSSIVFVSEREPHVGNPEVYVMNADGTDQTRLTHSLGNDTSPTWSPDGALIAFDSYRDGNSEIYVMHADGTNPIRLTNNAAFDYEADWSPDGSRIAFTSTRDGNREIYVMNSDGSAQSCVTSNSYWDFSPDWSSDGSKIAFASDRPPHGGNTEIYVMNADGTNQTRLTYASGNDYNPAWWPAFATAPTPTPTPRPTVTQTPAPSPTPTAAVTPSPGVGGTSLPTDKLKLLMPWVLGGGVVIMGVTAVMWKRKKGTRQMPS